MAISKPVSGKENLFRTRYSERFRLQGGWLRTTLDSHVGGDAVDDIRTGGKLSLVQEVGGMDGWMDVITVGAYDQEAHIVWGRNSLEI